MLNPLPALRWAVLIVALDPVVGHEQGGERRCVVVSYEPLHRSGQVTVCPITAARSVSRYPNEVPIPKGEAGQTKAGVILVHQVRTVSLNRASYPRNRSNGSIRYVSDPILRGQVRRALQRQLGLDIPLLKDGAI